MAVHRLNPEEFQRLLAIEPPAAVPAGYSVLHALAALDRDLLAQSLVEERYQPGDVLFRQGEPGDSVYLIWSGRVAIVRGDFSAPTVLGHRGPGETVGEMALLEGKPRVASVVALEDLRVLRMDQASFARMLNADPTIAAGIMASLSARLRQSAAQLETDAQAGRLLSQQVAQLRDEKYRLLEAQRLRQETADLIVHDLRNPLGAVSNALEMLAMVLPKETLAANQQLLDIADAACRRMRRLVDSLLDVARMEEGAAELHLAPLHLAPLLREALERERLAFHDRGIRYHCTVPADLPAVLADEERIDRVVANLVDNALKYTPAGGAVTVAAQVQGEYVVVSVSDTGPGIPPEERERVFERFTQLADRRKRRGFGLGLAFCRLAVEAHGGRIWVEPGEDGRGSRFAFTLPVA